MSKSFRDLDVWQRAMDLTTDVYRLTDRFPRHEVYGLTSQMRRCSVSIPSNVAEGSLRATKRDFAHFITIARGSCAELQTQLILALRLGYVAQEDFDSVEALSFRVARMLGKLLDSLRSAMPSEVSPQREQRTTKTTR